jgi:hypothetical protein
MGKVILLTGACLVTCGTLGGPAVAKSRSGDTCNSKDYSYLVGKNIIETRDVGDYRLVPAGSPAAATDPRRLTFVYDKGDTIISVSCG